MLVDRWSAEREEDHMLPEYREAFRRCCLVHDLMSHSRVTQVLRFLDDIIRRRPLQGHETGFRGLVRSMIRKAYVVKDDVSDGTVEGMHCVVEDKVMYRCVCAIYTSVNWRAKYFHAAIRYCHDHMDESELIGVLAAMTKGGNECLGRKRYAFSTLMDVVDQVRANLKEPLRPASGAAAEHDADGSGGEAGAAHAGGADDEDAVSEYDDWSCPVCTYINSAGSSKCDMCDTNAPEDMASAQRAAKALKASGSPSGPKSPVSATKTSTSKPTWDEDATLDDKDPVRRLSAATRMIWEYTELYLDTYKDNCFKAGFIEPVKVYYNTNHSGDALKIGNAVVHSANVWGALLLSTLGIQLPMQPYLDDDSDHGRIDFLGAKMMENEDFRAAMEALALSENLGKDCNTVRECKISSSVPSLSSGAFPFNCKTPREIANAAVDGSRGNQKRREAVAPYLERFMGFFTEDYILQKLFTVLNEDRPEAMAEIFAAMRRCGQFRIAEDQDDYRYWFWDEETWAFQLHSALQFFGFIGFIRPDRLDRSTPTVEALVREAAASASPPPASTAGEPSAPPPPPTASEEEVVIEAPVVVPPPPVDPRTCADDPLVHPRGTAVGGAQLRLGAVADKILVP